MAANITQHLKFHACVYWQGVKDVLSEPVIAGDSSPKALGLNYGKKHSEQLNGCKQYSGIIDQGTTSSSGIRWFDSVDDALKKMGVK